MTPYVQCATLAWRAQVNWQSLSEFGVISQKEVDDLLFTDSVDEAFAFITGRLEEVGKQQEGRTSPPP